MDAEQYESVNYHRTQDIGAAVAFLGCDGLIVPCARWACENLELFIENHALESRLEVLSSEEIDWQVWARDAGFLKFIRPWREFRRTLLVRATERTQGISRNQLLSDPSPWNSWASGPIVPRSTWPRTQESRGLDQPVLLSPGPTPPCPPVGRQAQGFPRSHGPSESVD